MTHYTRTPSAAVPVDLTDAKDHLRVMHDDEDLAIQRMVLAHAMTMNGVDGWTYGATETATGARLTITPPDEKSLVKLRALGFTGILAQGMHHQMHHLMIARGMAPHH